MLLALTQMYAPFEDDGDDLLSQLCQSQIFFSLLSSIVLKAAPNSPTMGVVLPILIALPPLASIAFESGIVGYVRSMSSPKDNGFPIPFTSKRVCVGIRGWSYHFLEWLLGIKHYVDEDELEEEDLLPELEIDVSTIPRAVRAAFDKYDDDQSGDLDYRELRDALKYYGHNVSHPMSAKMIGFYDDRPDSKLKIDEFHMLIRDLEQGLLRTSKQEPPSVLGFTHVPAHIVSSFRQYDLNKNGKLEKTELKTALLFYGVELGDEATAAILQQYDTTDDGINSLSLKEFSKLIIDIGKVNGDANQLIDWSEYEQYNNESTTAESKALPSTGPGIDLPAPAPPFHRAKDNDKHTPQPAPALASPTPSTPGEWLSSFFSQSSDPQRDAAVKVQAAVRGRASRRDSASPNPTPPPTRAVRADSTLSDDDDNTLNA